MDILAIFGLGALLRWLRHPRSQQPVAAQPIPTRAIAPTQDVPRSAAPLCRLLLRAGKGLLLAGLLLVVALLPWPTAWATSALVLPCVQRWQLWVLNNLDVVTFGTVIGALIEPLLLRLIRGGPQAPRLLWLLARLAWVWSATTYWRFRNWRVRVTAI